MSRLKFSDLLADWQASVASARGAARDLADVVLEMIPECAPGNPADCPLCGREPCVCGGSDRADEPIVVDRGREGE